MRASPCGHSEKMVGALIGNRQVGNLPVRSCIRRLPSPLTHRAVVTVPQHTVELATELLEEGSYLAYPSPPILKRLRLARPANDEETQE